MKTVWRVVVDRYSKESLAKSGRTYSVVETCDELIAAYNRQTQKPELEVDVTGIGMALADMLADHGIPLRRICGLRRIGGADVTITEEGV